jgi:hypothetical protein
MLLSQNARLLNQAYASCKAHCHSVIDVQRSGLFVRVNASISCPPRHPFSILETRHTIFVKRTFKQSLTTFQQTKIHKMPSSKGTPTDPELREQLKEGLS